MPAVAESIDVPIGTEAVTEAAAAPADIPRELSTRPEPVDAAEHHAEVPDTPSEDAGSAANVRAATDQLDRDAVATSTASVDDSRAPELPEDADFAKLDADVRAELRSLPKSLAEIVGRHLVAAGTLIDTEPEQALRHARYARAKASRVGVVREAAGLAAYHAGEWAEALAELRAARRILGGTSHLAVMADCERALGRPERALELANEADRLELPRDQRIELRIVVAGARRDLGQLDAAVVALQGPELDARDHAPWSARLFYAYADNLAAAGRTDEAMRWFINAAQADDNDDTDAAERAVELSMRQLDPASEAGS